MGGIGAILFGLGLRVSAKALPPRPPKPRAADFDLSTGVGYLEYQKDYNASQGATTDEFLYGYLAYHLCGYGSGIAAAAFLGLLGVRDPIPVTVSFAVAIAVVWSLHKVRRDRIG